MVNLHGGIRYRQDCPIAIPACLLTHQYASQLRCLCLCLGERLSLPGKIRITALDQDEELLLGALVKLLAGILLLRRRSRLRHLR